MWAVRRLLLLLLLPQTNILLLVDASCQLPVARCQLAPGEACGVPGLAIYCVLGAASFASQGPNKQKKKKKEVTKKEWV